MSFYNPINDKDGLICYFYAVFLLFMLFSIPIVKAQNADNFIDPVYGSDPLLYNGKAYSFYLSSGTGGSQFLYKDFDIKGEATIRGVTYSNLSLNYDIFNQKLILKYETAIGTTSLIEISDAWLETFKIGERKFEIISAEDTIKRIYQVLGDKDKKVLYYRSTEILLDNMKTTRSYYFSEVKKERFILSDNLILKYKSNRSFIRIFDPSMKDLIKKYMRTNGINVKNASDNTMNLLINYCSTLKKS